jgi:tryptophan synthase beta subunit
MYDYHQPDPTGHFGKYGGSFVSETLTHAINELKDAYAKYQHDPANSSPNSSPSWRTLWAAPLRSTTQPA